ncbi:DUF996 domain-containing protein [Thermococcus sp. CX2]|nr:DUF996 domain-containing protein [Thermococcus sp. CX2]
MVVVNVRSEKNLGMWGAILNLLGGFIPYIGGIIALVGFLMVLFSLKGISDATGDERPFKKYFYGVLFAIGGIIVIAVLLLSMLAVFPSGRELSKSAGIGIAVLFFVLLISLIIGSAYFQKQAWEAMYEITKTQEFRDAANWVWWGALTSIVLIGFILLLIAQIYIIIGFSKMPEEIGEEPAPSAEEVITW